MNKKNYWPFSIPRYSTTAQIYRQNIFLSVLLFLLHFNLKYVKKT